MLLIIELSLSAIVESIGRFVSVGRYLPRNP